MAVTHHGYNVLKMPGSSGIITVACDEKDAVCSLEHAYHAETVKKSDGEGAIHPPKVSPKKKKRLLLRSAQEAGAPFPSA